MKRKLFVTFYFVTIYVLTYSQTTFQKTIGGTLSERNFATRKTNDGGLIFAGDTQLGTGHGDIYLAKTDSAGNLLWTKVIGSLTELYGFSVAQTPDSGYVVTGFKDSLGMSATNDFYLLRTDSNGNPLWAKSYGGGNMDIARHIQVTTDGGFLICGETYSYGAGQTDAYAIKTDPNGNIVWAKTYGEFLGDAAMCSVQDPNGDYIICGFKFQPGTGNDYYLIKTNSLGNVIWSKTYGGASNDEIATSLQRTNDNGFIITGYSLSFGAGNIDIYLVKTDSLGNLMWSKTFGGTENDFGNYVQQTFDSGYLISGYTNSFGNGSSDEYLIKTDSLGNMLWSKTFGGTNDEQAVFATQSSDGGYEVEGMTWSFGSGMGDVFMVKTDPMGNSGCNQTNPVTIVTSPPTVEATTTTSVSGGIIAFNIPTFITLGGNMNTLCLMSGISPADASLLNVNVFPNPFTDVTTIQFDNSKKQNCALTLYDLRGQLVRTIKNITTDEVQIERQSLTSGLYFFQLLTDRQIIAIGKLAIE